MRRAAVGGLALALATITEPAAAEPIVWRDEWRRFEWYDYATTAAMLGASIGIQAGIDFPSDGSRDGLLFDDAVRDAFLARDRGGRDLAMRLGDTLERSAIVFPFLVDVIAVAWIGHGEPDVAWQMFLIDTRSLSVTLLMTLTAQHAVGRARPSVAACELDPQYERFCDSPDQHASFFSGHTAIAATMAGLTCAHHQRIPLYGGGWPDTAICLGGIGVATGVGVARIVNDRHWASDVLLGGAVGAFSGYVVPRWLSYGFDDPLQPSSMVLPLVLRDTIGLGWSGTF